MVGIFCGMHWYQKCKITSQFCPANPIDLATPRLTFWKEMTTRLLKNAE